MMTTFSSIARGCKIMDLSKYLSRKAGRLRWWGGSETKDRLCAGKPFRKRGARIYPAKMLTMEEQFFAVLVLLRKATSMKEMVRRAQLTAREVTSTRRIAEAIIHVERSIEHITEFLILQGEVDISIFHVLQQVFQVCSFLTNFQRPIVRDVVYSD